MGIAAEGRSWGFLCIFQGLEYPKEQLALFFADQPPPPRCARFLTSHTRRKLLEWQIEVARGGAGS